MSEPVSPSPAPVNIADLQRPGLLRYFSCLAYEALLLTAWLFILGVLYLALDALVQHRWPGGALQVPDGVQRTLQQLWYLAGLLGYFVLFWVRGGQTLAMKTWKLRLVSLDGGRVSVLQAVVRFFAAAMGIALLGVTWLWAFGSPQRLWLHDRLSKTLLIRVS